MSQQAETNNGILGRTGLTMSGGGYRAAAFHLGALDYLDHAGLIKQLIMLSTVSGGSFIGAKYALALTYKTPFHDFFRDSYFVIRDTPLVKMAIEELGKGKLETPSGRRDLIIAMSQVYDKAFLKTADGKPALLGTILNADIPLQELIINSTEFKFGLGFRFQRSLNSNAKIGNGRISIPRQAAAEISLSDIVAASSCFPGGYEPFAFPDDFVWSNNKVPQAIRDKFPKPVALMDGGVYDNQGIESLLLADDRNPNDLDMFIISDSSQETQDIYPFPEEKSDEKLTLGGIDLISRLIYFLCAISALTVGYQVWDKHQSGSFKFFWDFFLYLIPLILAGTTAAAIWWLRDTIYKKILPKIPQIGRDSWNDFKKLTVSDVVGMINLRITSLFAMANDVFMNRIRALVYRIIYTDDRYNKKRISNLIYHLKSGEKFSPLLDKLPQINKPSPKLQVVVDAAANMPTALWFDYDYQLPCLVACGQATLCYNLMKHTVRLYGNKPAEYPDQVKLLWNKLVSDWNIMVEDPYALIRMRLPDVPLSMPPV